MVEIVFVTHPGSATRKGTQGNIPQYFSSANIILIV